MFVRLSVLAAFFALCSLLSAPAFSQQGHATAHFIDVEKGDASLMEFPCGAILIDAGSGEGYGSLLTDYLDQFFVSRSDLNNTLSTVVLTHGHLDHTRNIGAILKRYRVKTLVVNGHFKKRGYKGLRRLLRQFPETKVVIADAENIPSGGLWHSDVDPLDCDGNAQGNYPDIRLLWGDARPQLPGWSDKFYKDENNHSVSLLVRWGQRTALFTGDLEKQSLKELLSRQVHILKDVDLYQISHHGYRSGTTDGFLEHINPRIAILSRPENRAWHEATMNRFNQTVRDKRNPVSIPVWNFSPPKKSNKSKQGKRPRLTSESRLDRAVYWTGRDGSIRVDLSDSPELAIDLGAQR